jgi:hypothetical protein
MSDERELEAMDVVDSLLVLMRETPGWDFNAVDRAFSYLRRMDRAFPHAPLIVSVANELRHRSNDNAK